MPYRYLEDIALADAAIEAWDSSLEGLLISAADAAVNVMVEDLDSVRPLVDRVIELGPEAADLLLYQLLQELVYYKDAERLLLRVLRVNLTPKKGGYMLRAEARGEAIDPDRHRLGADVKAVTLHRLSVTAEADGWHAFVILDI
jgi:SHS2 domain-containing protein